MPRIRCHYIDCVFLDDGYCGAAAIEVDPDVGCMTYSRADDLETTDDWKIGRNWMLKMRKMNYG